MVRVERDGAVAVVTLERGVTNALNPDLVARLREVVRGIAAPVVDATGGSTGVRGLVLQSANDKFFSIGLDIPELYGLERAAFTRFFRDFEELCLELFTLPLPTVAAVTGHAVAGGCLVALACDYRFIAAGHKLMGLNEAKLGVPVPWVGDCILADLAGTRAAREITYEGQFHEPDRLLALGVVDRVIPLDRVRSDALEHVRALSEVPAAALADIKRARIGPVETRIRSALDQRVASFVECWYSDGARRRLEEARQKFQR